jgi:tetratricopeptide (TPR) repeat protein
VTPDAVDRGTAGAGAGDERWFLNDEREFLLRSIDDAERERDAGDLSEADYAVLSRRDRTRLAEVEAELAALGPLAPAAAPVASEGAEVAEVVPRRRYGTKSRIGIVIACLLIVAGAVILVNHAVNPAAPGKAQKISDQLAAASILANDGDDASALQTYNEVLAEDPNDPVALAAGGWLEWSAGRAGRSATALRAGRQSEEKDIAVHPGFYGGHLYLGLILLDQDDNPKAAVTQFTAVLADGPSSSEIKDFAAEMVPAYTQANVALPAVLADATATPSTSTTTTTTTTSAP